MSPSQERLAQIESHFRAANYIGAAQLYLKDNALLREPLRAEHIKARLLGHWGTQPGLNLIYAHLNRLIQDTGSSVLLVVGPGHGAPAILADLYLEGTLSEYYPRYSRDLGGLTNLVRDFSWPGGLPSHLTALTPGAIHEGGELGYSLMHAAGAAFDNPDLLVACVIGDGEAETGPLATSWHSPKFLNPVRDGAVLPVLHLNGYKIANPTVLARMPEPELLDLMRGYGYQPYVVEGGFGGEDPMHVHRRMASTLDEILDRIADIQRSARVDGALDPPQWPMMILRTPKGWTGPKVVDGVKVEGTYRAHQVPLDGLATNPEHLRLFEEWMRSYRPEELFDAEGRPVPRIDELNPHGDRRMSANPHTNGGLLLRALTLPDFGQYGVDEI